MTQFQMLALGAFVVLLVAAYYKNIMSYICRKAGAGSAAVQPTQVEVEPSIAVTIVSDLISVTELRDKLSAEGCPEGVDACTALLRVIVEHTKKNDTHNHTPKSANFRHPPV